MRLILTALLFAGGLLYLFLGAGFMINPATSGADFGIVPNGTLGHASLRADFMSFFVVGGSCMIWGAWKRKGDPLLVSAALFGLAILGRTINLIAMGAYSDFWQPMLVEGVTVALCLIGSQVLPHHAFTGED